METGHKCGMEAKGAAEMIMSAFGQARYLMTDRLRTTDQPVTACRYTKCLLDKGLSDGC